MKLGVVYDGKGNFLEDLFADWKTQFETSVYAYQPVRVPLMNHRVNAARERRTLQKFLDGSDVVFFEWAGPILIQASQMRHKPKARIMVRLHSHELYEYAPRVNWGFVDHIIFVSQTMREKFLEIYPGFQGGTEVIYNSRPLDRFKLYERQFCGSLGMLCNLTPIKRVYETILALPELNQLGYRMHLHIGGEPRKGGIDERYYASMLRAVEKLNLREQVTFYGFVKDPQDWLKQIDIFISNSFWEGQQVALIEAMATGCYCLSHFWDGAEEMLPEEYLYTTQSSFIQKVIECANLSDAERTARQRHLHAIAVEKFDFEKAKLTYREVLLRESRNG